VSALSVSPDRSSFVLLVRRADPVANVIRTRWYAGRVGDAHLTDLGDGGEARLAVAIIGTIDGSLETPRVEWSPDGRWIAYTLARNGETQVWRSKTDGTLQEQVTHHPADVCDLAWSRDGRSILFSSGMSRAARDARRRERERAGYRYDEDLFSVADLMLPGFGSGDSVCESVAVSVTNIDRRITRAANVAEQEEFQAAVAERNGGIEDPNGAGHNAVIPPVRSAQGASVWLERTAAHSRFLRIIASPRLRPDPIGCAAPQCEGLIERVWWNRAGNQVLFWRREGLLGETSAFYAWKPGQPKVSTIWRQPDEFLEACDLAAEDVAVCVRETPSRPAHLIGIDLRSGDLKVVADVNSEFADIRLGKVERLEWDTGKFAWNEKGGRLEGLYPKRTFGYLIFPPDFDPSKKYPLFVEPYAATGFDNDVTNEHPLHAYAAAGIVVLHAQFPIPTDVAARLGASYAKLIFARELDFPHLNMLADSTLRGMDAVAGRGFIDERKVGIGGVSHGTYIPLYMLFKYDRIAATSISGASRGAYEYYALTRRGREAPLKTMKDLGYQDWLPKPEGEGREFWRSIDVADHAEAIKAPILMNLPASEVVGVVQLIRHLADAGKPYDAYVFTEETHVKWQPAHLSAIMNRNLDWFRFWLQSYEDPGDAKEDQYSRWRALRARVAAPD